AGDIPYGQSPNPDAIMRAKVDRGRDRPRGCERKTGPGTITTDSMAKSAAKARACLVKSGARD
ncbi:MAG: hypothetical protein ACREDR_16460, partial [Blastocatellia bacterium]